METGPSFQGNVLSLVPCSVDSRVQRKNPLVCFNYSGTAQGDKQGQVNFKRIMISRTSLTSKYTFPFGKYNMNLNIFSLCIIVRTQKKISSSRLYFYL